MSCASQGLITAMGRFMGRSTFQEACGKGIALNLRPTAASTMVSSVIIQGQRAGGFRRMPIVQIIRKGKAEVHLLLYQKCHLQTGILLPGTMNQLCHLEQAMIDRLGAQGFQNDHHMSMPATMITVNGPQDIRNGHLMTGPDAMITRTAM